MANATGRPTAPLVLSSDERDYLERQVRRHRVARSMSERCRIILRCADGLSSKVVAAKLGIHEHTVGKWRRRFLKGRIEGLLDEARPGRPRTIDDDQVAAVIERALRSTPVDATHWSIRSMAGAAGFSHTTIRRIWAALGYIHARNAARLVRQEWLDGCPFIVGEFVAHDSRLQFGSLNHAPGGITNPPRPIMTDANTLISLPLSGAQPTWRDMLVAASRSKMTQMYGPAAFRKRDCAWLRKSLICIRPV